MIGKSGSNQADPYFLVRQNKVQQIVKMGLMSGKDTKLKPGIHYQHPYLETVSGGEYKI